MMLSFYLPVIFLSSWREKCVHIEFNWNIQLKSLSKKTTQKKSQDVASKGKTDYSVLCD